MLGKNKLLILWVEDDANDVLLLRRAFQKAGIAPVHICTNGEDAMRYIKGESPYDDRETYPSPSLIITDIKMPRATGLDLLRWLRAHPKCGAIPVVVFSASADGRDIENAYRLGASSYFQKPNSLNEVIEVVAKILDYWREAFPPDTPAKCG